jgi:dihydroorotate dehydrogenase electron transfer subunit
MKSLIFDAKVVSNRSLGYGHYLLECESPAELNSSAGQFLQLYLGEGRQFLRRPFSLFEQSGRILKILYKIRGSITAQLSQVQKGELLNFIGPLGNEFPLPECRDVVLISGGTGFAPLYFLAKSKLRTKKYKLRFLIAAQGKEAKIFGQFAEELGAEVSVATEDGSVGRKGNVLVLLDQLSKESLQEEVIFSAGPLQMLKKIYSFSERQKMKSFFSLEAHFACGLGFCWGCCIGSKKGPLRVCKDGPVFEGDSIIWEKI